MANLLCLPKYGLSQILQEIFFPNEQLVFPFKTEVTTLRSNLEFPQKIILK